MAKNTKQDLFDAETDATSQGPVECLGLTFPNDEARRSYFLEKLREKLKDPVFRKIESFPIGTDEDILAFSDSPHYTACPNPFISDFIRQYGHTERSLDETPRTPYVGELRSGERHPIYSFHPYHTKVPPEVIYDLILHYTKPGDLLLDGFAGTGMTGVAAREAGRHAILSDLSPIAGFISGVNCTFHNWEETCQSLKAIIEESEETYRHFYVSQEGRGKADVSYYVWSDVFTCPECSQEFPFFPHGVIHHGNKVETRKSFSCPHCNADLNVRRVERVISYGGKKKALAWVSGKRGKTRINREPNEADHKLAKSIEDMAVPHWFPKDRINPNGYSAKLAQLGDKAITDVSRFLSKRNLIVFSDLWYRTASISNTSIRNLCRAVLTSVFTVISERQGYFGGGGGMSGNLYVPIVRMEKNVYEVLKRKLRKTEEAERQKRNYGGRAICGVQSATKLEGIPDASIDYIYTDPPFGANIIYSEMNLILEGWLRVKSNSAPEAVIDPSRNRTFDDYSHLMRKCFQEYYRVLKPGHWMTVEFHNTLASVWNLIQNGIGESGFVIAQVGVFDKGSTTILADIRPGAAKYDLIISAYKPDVAMEERFHLACGTENAVWEFVNSHLGRLPVFVEKDGRVETVIERTKYLLFDRMVAFHIQHGVAIPISASEFYLGLHQRLPERDGMYFLANQVTEYNSKRLEVKEFKQSELFVSDEKSAIQWVRQQLTETPRTYQDLQPLYMREAQRVWEKHEQPLELVSILEQNFVKDPENTWRVPDPRKEADLEQIRYRALLKEFQQYLSTKGKLKVVRTEALRAGFKECWQKSDYPTIVQMARRVPDAVIQEDQALLMYYDNALMRVGE
jgi:DNA modification methylase/transposase-like protein